MTKSNLILVICLILFISSCQPKTNSRRANNIHVSEVEKSIELDSTQAEDFSSFLAYFTKDTIFQKTRVLSEYTRVAGIFNEVGEQIGDTVMMFAGYDGSEYWAPYTFLIHDSIKNPYNKISITDTSAEVFFNPSISGGGAQYWLGADFIKTEGKWFLERFVATIEE